MCIAEPSKLLSTERSEQ